LVDEIMSDEVLVEGLRRGSSEAYAQLWQKYGDHLIHFLQSLGADPDDAADAAVDGVARAVEKIDQFDPQKAKGRSPFRNWLFTIARHLWHDQQRKRKNIVYFDDEFRDTSLSPTTDETPTPIAEALNHALSMLPDNQRQTVTMHFYDNLPLSQIAQLMGVPEGTVRQWKKRALAALQSALQDLPIFADFVDGE
jgi:RNA polymerase sigma-70 factor (ECF subfamily)